MSQDSSTAQHPASRTRKVEPRHAWRMLAVVAVAGFSAIVGQDTVRAVAKLYPLAESAHPYFVPAHATALYLLTPLAVAGCCFLLLAPGLLASLALNAAKGVGQWVLTAFALSLVTVSLATGIAQAILGSPIRGSAFAAVVLSCAVLCFGFLMVRLTRGHRLAWPLAQQHAGVTLLSMVIVPLLILIVLTPKFYWENFNGDGAHAFEAARLLLHQPFPFWSPDAGYVAAFPGVNSMLFAYPASWFIRLFGEVEASARLPILLFLVPMYGAILEIVDQGRPRTVGLVDRWLVWFGLVVYVVVMAYSATYDPYSADIALPATQDTLLMVCFLGCVLAFLLKQPGWLAFFTGLTYLCSAGSLLLLGLWLLSVILIWKPRPWRRLGLMGVVIVGCFVAAAVTPALMEAAQLPIPGNEHAALEMLKKFQYLQWADYRRIAFLVVPSGILPALALIAWRRQDQLARTLTVVTITYFLFFYIQLITSLHYFVPVMILPMVVFWRSDLTLHPRYRSWILACAAGSTAIALLLSLPTDASPNTSARQVGESVQDVVGGYGHSDPAAFRRSEILEHLFPIDWEISVPHQSYGGSPLVWYYYANQPTSTTEEKNYVITLADQPVPPGMQLLAQKADVALYIRSESVWAEHRALRPSTLTTSRIYSIPRDMLFRGRPMPANLTIIDMLVVAKRFELGRIILRELEVDY